MRMRCEKFDGCRVVALYTIHSGFGIMPSQSFPGFRKDRLPKTRALQMKLVLTLAIVVFSVPAFAARFTSEPAGRPITAAELYAKHCASCHGKDGRARTFKAKFNHARDLTDPLWQDEVSDERLFNSIMNGKKKMPSYRKKLTEEQINSLIAYVRTLAR